MGAQSNEGLPVLWQLEISHYSEKVRWALEHKRIAHVRRSPLPGVHMPVALWLTRGATASLPLLELDGETIADSTAIIAALERRYPENPLYPEDPAELRRALELEEFFDEQLGPPVRQVVFHDLVAEPEVFAQVAAAAVPPTLQNMPVLTNAYARTFATLRWRATDDGAAADGRAQVSAAMDRLDAELDAGGGEFLVGGRLSVADITAAALFYPLVAPENGPTGGQGRPEALEEYRHGLAERPGFRWVEERFAAR
jgi:glutathione S-transferase